MLLILSDLICKNILKLVYAFNSVRFNLQNNFQLSSTFLGFNIVRFNLQNYSLTCLFLLIVSDLICKTIFNFLQLSYAFNIVRFNLQKHS